MSIPTFISDIAAVNTMFGLGNTTYPKQYFSIHDLGTTKINPLQNVVPLFDSFNPYVLNFLAITGPYVRLDGMTYVWDDSEVESCRELLIQHYSNFSKYELHIFIDNDSPAVNEDNEEQVAITDGYLDSLANSLSIYGVTYHGRLGTAAVQALMTQVTATFYEGLV